MPGRTRTFAETPTTEAEPLPADRLISETPPWFVYAARVAGQVAFDGQPLYLGDNPDELDEAASKLEVVRDELRQGAAEARGRRLLSGLMTEEEAWRVLFAVRRHGWRIGDLGSYEAYCVLPAGKGQQALQLFVTALWRSARCTVHGARWARWIVRHQEFSETSYFDLVINSCGDVEVTELPADKGAERWVESGRS